MIERNVELTEIFRQRDPGMSLCHSLIHFSCEADLHYSVCQNAE